jgi:hypothetical protein
MAHPFKNYLITRDGYFEDPDLVVKLSERVSYTRASYYPGLRSQNLMFSEDPQINGFAEYFSNRLSYDIFPGLRNYHVDIFFHQNDVYNDIDLNQGWVHTDDAVLAGLVYLVPEELDFNTGTSIFTGEGIPNLRDREVFSQLNLHGIVEDDYKDRLKDNRNSFKETIRIGNCYNRMIGYDSKMFHCPNNYKASTGVRKTLLFFIYSFEHVDNK